ncbi:MAG: hypothetical protein ABI877_13285 [Gemmatimonadaceae bacterium]
MRRVLFALMVVSTGCFSYTQVETAAPTATTVVRVELTDAGTVAMTPSLGESVQVLEGPVVANSGGALELDVRLLRRRGETLMKEWPGDHITIPAANIRDISVKSVDRRKTTAALIGGGVAVGLVFVIASNVSSLFGGGNGKIIPSNVR